MKEAWSDLLDIVLRQSAELDQFLSTNETRVDLGEFQKLKSAVGSIMGEHYFSVIEPVSRSFPDLKPGFLIEDGSSQS